MRDAPRCRHGLSAFVATLRPMSIKKKNSPIISFDAAFFAIAFAAIDATPDIFAFISPMPL